MNELAINHEPKLLDAIHSGKPAPGAPRKKEIFVLDEEISGWEEISAIKTIAAGLRKGDTLTLRREPDDETRSFVIGVYDKLGQKIGYLDGGNRKIVARLMDAGKQFRAELAPRNGIASLSDTSWVAIVDEDDNDEYDYEGDRLFRVMRKFLSMNIYWVE